MSLRNDFVLFGGAAGANTLSPADYAAAPARLLGVQAGTASSKLANTSWRQSSMMAAMIGQFINLQAGLDANDDGNVNTLEASFEQALRNTGSVANDAVRQAILASGYSFSGTDPSLLADAIARGIFLGGLGGGADSLVGTIPNNVFLLTVLPWTRFRCIAPQTNATNATTFQLMNVGSLGGSITGNLLRRDGTAIAPGDVPTGRPFTVQLDSNQNFRLEESPVTGGGTVGGVTFNNIIPFLTSQNWQVPDGITKIFGRAWGAGGGGGGSSSNSTGGRGGGGGEYRQGVFAVTPLSTLVLTIGTGGSLGASSPEANGGAGTSTSIGSLMTAMPGLGGNRAGIGGPGASGGTGGSGGIGYAGQSGGSPYLVSSTNIIAGPGGSVFGGYGPLLGGQNASGIAGFQPGQGAAGGAGQWPGARGADGLIEIWY